MWSRRLSDAGLTLMQENCRAQAGPYWASDPDHAWIRHGGTVAWAIMLTHTTPISNRAHGY